MLAARRLLAQCYLALFLCAATLLLELLVPTGYIVGSENGRVTIELCSGVADQPTAMAMSGMHPDVPGHGKTPDNGRAETG